MSKRAPRIKRAPVDVIIRAGNLMSFADASLAVPLYEQALSELEARRYKGGKLLVHLQQTGRGVDAQRQLVETMASLDGTIADLRRVLALCMSVAGEAKGDDSCPE